MNPDSILPYDPMVSLPDFIRTTHGPAGSIGMDLETTFNNYIQAAAKNDFGFFYIFGPKFKLMENGDPPQLRKLYNELINCHRGGDDKIGLYLAPNGVTNFRLHREMARLWAINVNIAGGNKVDN